MHQNHLSFHRTQTTSSMSSSHPYTVVDDEDDADICPVCDGQCTCRISMSELSLKSPAPPVPSLKIKFTLPPSLIAKRRLDTTPTETPLKKRGRPPKFATPKSPPPQKTTAKLNKLRQNLKAKAAISKKVIKRRRVAVQTDQNESYSSDTSTRRIYNHDKEKFPTFVSASALSSISSTSDSSDSSSLSDFDVDADSDIQAEEENFIVADIHDKAQLRRELLGDDDPQLKKRYNSDWVIRPSKKSVVGSDPEQMDVDTDATAHNKSDDDEAEEDDNDDKDDPDPVEEHDGDTDQRHHYVGLATGWSEEEDESSFDADLFFANLSDSSFGSTSSTRRHSHSYTPGGIDADQSSSTSDSPALESLPFEVTENWDGHLIFTNGLVGEAESRGIVDIHFEKDAERFIIDSDADDDDSSSNASYHHDPSQVPESSDIDMFSISDADAGYEEEDGGEANEGDTTDEELVGHDSLPNERAMRLFTLPMGTGLSAINPMSTVSPIVKRRHRDQERKRWRKRLRSGPRPADILAGETLFWADDGDQYASSSSDSMLNAGKGKGKRKVFFSPSSLSHADHQRQPSTPRTGLFVPTGETRQAVIGEDRKGTDVPSPHPRFYGRRNRVQCLLKKHLQCSAPSATNTNCGSSPSSPFHHLLSSAAASPLTATEDFTSTNAGDEYDTGCSTPCPCPAEADDCIVELDDVLEASFLDDLMDRECGSSSLTAISGANSGLVEDSSTAPTIATTDSAAAASVTADEASNKHLTRWDIIPIGAFRQTREQQAWGPGSRSSTVNDYGGVIKSGATALLWQNSGTSSSTGVGGAGSSKKNTSSSIPTSLPKSSASRSKGSSSKAAKRRKLMMASSTMSSPLVLPFSSASLTTAPPKSHSSSLVPHSHSSHSHQPKPTTTTTTHKNRKELRREKRLLKKKTTTSQSSSSQQSSSIPQQPSFFSNHPYIAHSNNASNNNHNHLYHHQFHTHQHHPNLKMRGTSSSQRMGYFGGAVPPLNL